MALFVFTVLLNCVPVCVFGQSTRQGSDHRPSRMGGRLFLITIPSQAPVRRAQVLVDLYFSPAASRQANLPDS
jgi:hypothetical protein